jgi:hypothetical protein
MGVDMVLGHLCEVPTNAMHVNMIVVTKATTSRRFSYMSKAESVAKMVETMCVTAEQTSKHELL